MIVDNLEKAGLVRRERLPEDRRYVRVHLTESGRERIVSLFPRHVGSITCQMSVLSAAEQTNSADSAASWGLERSHRKKVREKIRQHLDVGGT